MRQSVSGGAKRKRAIMFYVYILQSLNNPERFYIGYTTDLKKRVNDHNAGYSIHTRKFKPWKIKNYFAFDDAVKAENFETYLKSGNGRIFCKKYL